jgi:hypothetical protein
VNEVEGRSAPDLLAQVDETPDGLEEFRVPVVVFTTVRAVDFTDAAFVASAAIRQVLRKSSVNEVHTVVQLSHSKGPIDVRVHAAMEAGIAGGNGYLWTAATSKAYREYP